ncbi:hypothetical protein ACI3KW_04135 [Devosia sp. ZW T5_3]|uniref:hypothetical protein n=1 Tax=Devosia sp. ZW T5_3 TaxID=3378085 RepID=UPI0038526CFB
MKLAISLATIVALTQSSFAEECWMGQESQMTAVSWSAVQNEQGWTEITIEIRNNFDKDIKSSIARAVFSSENGPLDEAGAPIFPQQIAAGQTRTIKVSTDAAHYKTLIGATEGNVQLQICAQIVGFDDGTDERFVSPRSGQ